MDEVLKKASKRLYFLMRLKRARVPPNDPVPFYTACIMSIISYAVPASNHALTQHLKKELVRLEKRAISIIVPGASYNPGLEDLGVLPLGEHHDQLCITFLSSILSDPNHKIRNLLHPTKSLPQWLQFKKTARFSSTQFAIKQKHLNRHVPDKIINSKP